MKFGPTPTGASVVTSAAQGAGIASRLQADPTGSPSYRPDPLSESLDIDRYGYVRSDQAPMLRNFSKAYSEAAANHGTWFDRDEFMRAQAIYECLKAKAYLDDSVITARVKTALVQVPDVIARDVKVHTDNGAVLLSGFVECEKQARRAQELAASINGVTSVKSDLWVRR